MKNTNSVPSVTVCIPTYNRKDYLKETLQSVFTQTYKDYEVVIVDDGSTDGTEEMIKNAGYPVRYYWVSHTGQYAVRNKLIELAQGEYITFVDSDDLLFPDTIEKLMQVIEVHSPDVIAYGAHVGLDEKGRFVKRKQHLLPSGNITAELFEFIFVHSCGMMCPKKFFEEVGGFDTSLKCCAFYKLLLKMSVKYKFIPVEGPTFKRRRHKGNVSVRSFSNRKVEFDVLEDFYFNHGGKELIPSSRAMKRLSREGYRAGRCAIKEGMFEQARQLLSQSFYRHPNIKSLIHWIRSLILKTAYLPKRGSLVKD
jgi:glycosyltransferase involved in cell wall biosynthesis